jgi:hypothetical protein
VTTNTKTGQELLSGLGQFIDDDWTGTTSSAATTTTLIDAYQTDFGDYAMVDGWIKITSGDNDGEVRRVTANDGSTTITVNPAFSNLVASGVTYEFHRWNPQDKLQAFDRARFVGFPHISRVVEDATVTTDGFERRFQFGTGLAAGPYTCWRENPLPTSVQWNALKNPVGDSLDGWTLTGAGATVSIYEGGNFDRSIPKYTNACTRITVPDSTTVLYSQGVGNFTGITADNAQGRKVTFGKWVFARVGARVHLRLADDGGNTEGANHQGCGWEYLEVSHELDHHVNATTLDAILVVESGDPLAIFWNHAWLVFGDVPDIYDTQITNIRVQRDGSSQTVFLPDVEEEGYQLKLVGRGHLSALGESLTATMEVDDGMAELLYAYAARVLFEESGMASEESSVVAGRIATVLNRVRESSEFFDSKLANPPGLNSPYYGN